MNDEINILQRETVINWLLGMGNESEIEITPKKLQKLLYYVYAWGLVFLNETSDDINTKMFESNFQAWVHGPVDAEVYHRFSDYRFNPIDTQDIELPMIDNQQAFDVLTQVWNVYSRFDANELEALTHQETPWQNAREGLSPLESSANSLDDRIIFNFYGSQISE